tara:strand:- start:1893 stop:2678 length:786 start_codon:yes stop_codon:yes gene_type:complete
MLINIKFLRALFLAILFQSTQAFAQKASFLFTSKLETDFKTHDQYDKILNLSFALIGSYPLNKKTKVSLVVPFLKSLTGTRDFNYLDASLSFKYQNFKNIEKWSMSTGLIIGLPYSEASRKKSYLQTKIGVTPSLSYTFRPNLIFSGSSSFIKYFHRSNTNISGSSNNSYILSFSTGLTYVLKKSGSISFSGSFLKMITYENNTRDRYAFEGSYTRNFSKKLSGSLGFSNSGEPLDYNGDVNTKVFDVNTAQAFGKISIVF